MSARDSHGEEPTQVEALVEYLKSTRGFDLSSYKRGTLRRRIDKRLSEIGVNLAEYQDYLEVHPEEFALLFDRILINVTSFFRDPEGWAYLREKAIPAMLERKGPRDQIRVWSAGCASGEEAYSLAICIAEALGDKDFLGRVKIYATDLDEPALAQARQATYPAKSLEEVPGELVDRYFEPVGPSFQFRRDLRRAVIFGKLDLLSDAPISRVDVLACRNVLMYFNLEAQTRILRHLHFALDDDGVLFLGKAETLMTHGGLFDPIDLNFRLFSKRRGVAIRDHIIALAGNGGVRAVNHAERSGRLQALGFDSEPFPQVMVDADNSLVSCNQEARRVFGLKSDDIGRPFLELELSYRPAELRPLIEQAYAERQVVDVESVEHPVNNKDSRLYDITVTPFFGPSGERLGVSIVFIDVTVTAGLHAELDRSNQEMETVAEELQSTNEELETTNEELQSTVEELETTNEELQSTNEELETTNEELQSTNSELQSINDDVRIANDKAEQLNTFLTAILSSVQAGIIVLDRNLVVQLWNPRSEELWGMRSEEVVGQPLLGLDIGLPSAELATTIRACLDGKSQQTQISAVNRRGQSVHLTVSLTPLMDAEPKPMGAVLVMESAPLG